MIRLRFVDKYCNNLRELRDFLSAHAGEEKNRYHESVAAQFRSGLILRWLIQEQAYLAGKGREEEANLLLSLVDAMVEADGKLITDTEIYSWMMRVFCSMTEASPSLNPFRYVDVKKIVLFYNQRDGYFSGYIVYEIIVPAKETFVLKASIGEDECDLIKLTTHGRKGIEYKQEFHVPTEISVTENNIVDVKLLLDSFPISSSCIFVCTGTNFEDYYIVATGSEVFISRKEDSQFFVLDLGHFNRIEGLSENGVIRAISKAGDPSFLNFDGQLLSPTFKRIQLVGDGLAAIWTNSRSVIFVTADGDERFDTELLTDVSVFSDGYLAVRRASNGDWGYLRKDGTIIGSYAIAGDFQYGRARVFRKEWSGDKWYSIDKTFHEIEISAPSEAIRPSTNPDRLNGMHIKEYNGGWGLFTDDGYPVPITFNLPDLNEKLLFEL